MEKWQEQVEEILREHYQGSWTRKMAEELIEATRKVEMPPGDAGQFLDRVLKHASEKNPMMAAYIGFRLGVAYERYLNASRRV